MPFQSHLSRTLQIQSSSCFHRWLPLLGDASAQRHTLAGGAREESLLLVENIAIDEADGLAGPNYSRFSPAPPPRPAAES